MNYLTLSTDEKKLFSLNYQKIVKLHYFDRILFFLNESISAGKKVNGIDADPWVNWTGLTTDRPKNIIDFLIINNIIKTDINVLDIGCGLAEMGIEINRRKIQLNYTGLDINPLLIEINNLNLNTPNYKFNLFDINNDSLPILNQYDIVMMMGAAADFFQLSTILNDIIKPKYIVCESHINRDKDLDAIIKPLINYKIILTYNFKVTNDINPYNYPPAYIRKMYVCQYIEIKK